MLHNMTAIYTKDGLTVHFPARHAADIEYTIQSLLTTALVAIQNAPDNINDTEKGCISQVIRLAHDLLPMEYDYHLMMNGRKDTLKDAFATLQGIEAVQ